MLLLKLVLLLFIAAACNICLLPLMEFLDFAWAMKMTLITAIDISVGWYGHEILDFLSSWTKESHK